jgi:hypothetical protein
MENNENIIKNIADEAISRMNKKITDEVFLIIQNDRELMQDYLRAVEKHGLDLVNKTIGKAVKKKYGLINLDEREDNPSSTLIQSHQKFE